MNRLSDLLEGEFLAAGLYTTGKKMNQLNLTSAELRIVEAITNVRAYSFFGALRGPINAGALHLAADLYLIDCRGVDPHTASRLAGKVPSDERE